MNKEYTFNTHNFNLFIQEKWDGENMDKIKQIIDKYYPDKLFVNKDGFNWLIIYKKPSGTYSEMYPINDYVHIYPYRYWDPLGIDDEGMNENIIEIKDYEYKNKE